MNLDLVWQHLETMAVSYAPKLLLAALTLYFGWKLATYAVVVADKALERASIEITLRRFLLSILGALSKLVLIISVASMVGIETTSLLAVLGAAGLAIGLALQGSLSNFAGGVLILIFKPMKVGDFIEAQGVMGVVSEIQIFTTKLVTGDNKVIIVPNGPLANGNIINYSANATRRVDFEFAISAQDNIDAARDAIALELSSNELVLADPEPVIVVGGMLDGKVKLVVRAWVSNEDYWPVFYRTNENVKKALDQQGITVPQREFRLTEKVL